MEDKTMKKPLLFLLLAGFVAFLPCQNQAQSPVSFVLNASPLSLLISPDIDGFSVSKSSGSIYYYTDYKEQIEGFGSFTPSIKAGIGINLSILYLDITGGIGYSYNAAFSAPFYGGDFALRFKLGKIVTIGPHFGTMIMKPKWTGSGDFSNSDYIDFSTMFAFIVGPTFTLGKKVCFVTSIDYVMGKSDVTTTNGWVANSSELNLSGFQLNYGILLRLP